MIDAPEPVMLSALEHYSYCPRQCALIHVEQVWDENIYTLRGRDLHRHADEAGGEDRCGVRIERALPLWSERLGLVGKADVVEFVDGIPCPVEYKSGRSRKGHHEELQLCSQALCLAEMFGVAVPKGALYWHGSRERREVVFTDKQVAEVEGLTDAVRNMIGNRQVPPPVNDKRCEGCSLKESCLPAVIAEKDRSRKAARKLFIVEGGM